MKAGLAALSEGGLAAVRVELLAKALGITKGSFYWHFARREDLLGAMLGEWEQAQTQRVIETVEAQGGDPRARLVQLSDALLTLDMQLEAAIRGWARTDPEVGQAVGRIDLARLAYLQSILERAGVPAAQAEARARLIYFSLIGELMSGDPNWLEKHRAAIELNRDMILAWP